MKFRTSEHLTENQVESGLKMVMKDGLATEAMVNLAGGAFLIAFAMHMGASNFQIGLLAALPMIANIFQMVSIWLVQRYNNRRAIAVFTSIFARAPLFMIAFLPFLFTPATGLKVLVFFLFIHYFVGSVSGISWNSWMKDLVPENKLGSFFSRRNRMTQILSVSLSFVAAMALDFVKKDHPTQEVLAYSVMFVLAGIFGFMGIWFLSRTPEPKSYMAKENIFKLIKKPLKDKNFRKFLVFNSFWAFSLNLATPFFTIYLMKTIQLPLAYIIGLGTLNQVSGIVFVKLWGKYSDQYSNKTIMRICAPIYIACIFAWTFTTMPGAHSFTMPLLILIHIFMGISMSGITLAMNNIGIKLAPKDEAVVYISARTMITNIFPAFAPLLGGLMADFFGTHQLSWNLEWKGPGGISMLPVFELQAWDFFFVIAGVFAIFSLRKLRAVKEEGEVEKKVVFNEMLESAKRAVNEQFTQAIPVFVLMYRPIFRLRRFISLKTR
jgi:MFS family permease